MSDEYRNIPGYNPIIDVRKLTEQKKQYEIELVFKSGPWDLATNYVKFRSPLILNGIAEWSKDGTWSTSFLAATLIGTNTGEWDYSNSSAGSIITLWENEYGRAICGTLEKVPKFPISLGMNGSGSVKNRHGSGGSKDPTWNWIDWKVVARTF